MSIAHDGVIIEAEHNLTLMQRLVSMSLTTLLWLFWMYLWMPLISLIGWYFGIQLIYDQMVLREGWYSLIKLLLVYALIVAALSGLLLVWARINYYRFAGRERRRRAPDLSLAVLASDFGLSRATVEAGQASRIAVVYHDETGMIAAIETHDVPPAVTESAGVLVG
ncbi:poly-beta-1,6-N-acetyl-D-glucosamine biosynthesis protein PgaD [Crenobacter sp. SG2305]|uniref:poly-beta-1,6-N-acetyl-D-glucosamine biosynthesis protein PgaD n=1 Tax=Crenobacter oryzisoli TaxID=3056844 RepID=UPI0025AAA57D|nr:poly-beta-1,6-N-acetyl-D-glucosamine biosynthesis protein PgaD [Crenobacter sp. SG2305]MDN0084718.1 poly-beta-1,6-N-acetyl-D-glucosamine biosynthesis protein PgaD [Crenobacter sp. SG2305]